MRYEIHNWGPTRRIPYKEDVLLVNNETRITDDAELAKHLGKFPLISVKKLNNPIAKSATLPIKSKKGNVIDAAKV